MRFHLPIAIVLVWLCVQYAEASDARDVPELKSPSGHIALAFRLNNLGVPCFDVTYKGRQVMSGTLGLEFAGSGPLRKNLKVTDVRRESSDATYEISVGKASQARDHHNQLAISLQESNGSHRQLGLVFRAFDDGVAFRYLIPKQKSLGEFNLTDEHSRFSLAGDPTAHFLNLGAYTTSYERYYNISAASSIGEDQLVGLPILFTQSAASPPLWFAVTEANLTDYAGMYLSTVKGEPGTMESKLSPLPDRKDGAKVLGKTPHQSPWRVAMISENPGRLIESNIVFHLSDPPAIKDTSWIKPGKTTFPWWNGYVLEGVDFEPGVNTATMKHYIDFCAEHGIAYHSLDGLDIAWYGGPIRPNGPTDITNAAPSIDLPEVLRYAKDKGVGIRLWMHWKALRPQIDEAFRKYEEWGIEGVMVDFMDRDDQEMVRFYHEIAEKAAKHHLTVTLHGAYKPTGMERTWPNVLSYEGVYNQEHNKWAPKGSRGTPPEHNLDVAFVRMLAGPLDYHQGGMRSALPEDYHPRDKAPPVQGTRGHQLAMYVVYQNHLPMMVDYPAAYRGQAGLEFLVQIPTTWDETRALHAEVGKCLIIARRKDKTWYLGGMTAKESRELMLPLDFLATGKYSAELLLDKPAGGANALESRTETTSRDAKLHVKIPRAGGFVARLAPQK